MSLARPRDWRKLAVSRVVEIEDARLIARRCLGRGRARTWRGRRDGSRARTAAEGERRASSYSLTPAPCQRPSPHPPLDAVRITTAVRILRGFMSAFCVRGAPMTGAVRCTCDATSLLWSERGHRGRAFRRPSCSHDTPPPRGRSGMPLADPGRIPCRSSACGYTPRFALACALLTKVVNEAAHDGAGRHLRGGQGERDQGCPLWTGRGGGGAAVEGDHGAPVDGQADDGDDGDDDGEPVGADVEQRAARP